jgi:hypothetical protein
MADLAAEWEQAEPLQADWDSAEPVASGPEFMVSHGPEPVFTPAEPPKTGKLRALDLGAQRGMAAVPGLLGLDRAKVAAASRYAYDRVFGDSGVVAPPSFGEFEGAERAEEQAAERDRPILTALGIGAGAAPLAAAAPVAMPAGAALGARVAAAGTTAALQSAAVEGGVTSGLPVDERLKRMAIAALAGGGLGSLAPVAAPGLSRAQLAAAAPAEPASGRVAAAAADRALKATGATKADLAKVRDPQAVGRALLDEPGVKLRSPRVLAETAGQAKAGYGRRIGGAVDAADAARADDYVYHVTPRENVQAITAEGLRPDAPKLAEGGPHGDTRAVFLGEADTIPTYRDLYGDDAVVLRVRRDAAGDLAPDEFSEGTSWMTERGIAPSRIEAQAPDGTWAPLAPGGSGGGFNLAAVTARARADILAKLQADPLQKTTAEKVAQYLADLDAQGPTVSASEGHAIRKQLDNFLRGANRAQDPESTFAKAAVNDVRGIVDDELGATMERAGQGAEWEGANAGFSALSDAVKLAKKGVARREGNRSFGFAEQVAGGPGAIVGTLAGGVPGGAAGYVGASLVANTVKRYGNPVAARSLDRLAKVLASNPERLGSFAAQLKAVEQKAGPQGLAAAHYVLSHSSPEYRARFVTAVGGESEQDERAGQ